MGKENCKNMKKWAAKDLKIGFVKLTPFNKDVPEDVKALVAAEQEKIINGSWDVFWGPIRDQTGKEMVADGQKMADKDMLLFSWFVEGVEGDIPKSQ